MFSARIAIRLPSSFMRPPPAIAWCQDLRDVWVKMLPISGRSDRPPHSGHTAPPLSCSLIDIVRVTSFLHPSQKYSYTGMAILLQGRTELRNSVMWVSLRPPERVDHPACGAQQPTVSVARADELGAERQAIRPAHERHAQRRQTAQRPQRAEDRIAGGGQARRGNARGRRRQERVVFLLEQLGEAFVQPRNLRERLEITRRGMTAAPLDSPAEPIGEARASLVPLAREVHRNFRLHDEAVPFPCLLDRSRQHDFLDAIPEALDELR